MRRRQAAVRKLSYLIEGVLSILWKLKILVVVWKVYFTSVKELKRAWYTFFVKQQAQSVGDDLSVWGKSKVSNKTVLGDNVNFNGFLVRGTGPVEIGDNFHSGPDCRILTRNHNYDNGDAIPYDDTYVVEEVVIEDNVWFGAGVTVVPGVHIEEGAIIQADTTVVDDVPKGAIVGGHPGKVISSRDMEHYEKLKEEGKFH